MNIFYQTGTVEIAALGGVSRADNGWISSSSVVRVPQAKGRWSGDLRVQITFSHGVASCAPGGPGA
jgi:hypothetical protein